MNYVVVPVQDPLLRERRVNAGGLLFSAAQLEIPAVSFGDTDPLRLDLPNRENIGEWSAATVDLPDVYRYRITDAVVHPPFGIVTIDNYVVRETLDHAPFHLPGYARAGDEVTLPAVEVGATLDEAIHVMGSNYDNHFHFMAEVLPRLQIEPLAPYPFDGTILFPPVTTLPLQEMLVQMVRTGRTVCSLAGPRAVHVRSLVFLPNLAGAGYAPHPRLATFFDNLKRFLNVTGAPNRRIYITRRDTEHRVLVNEDEVIAAVVSAGFEVVNLSGLNLVEQARLFTCASHVIGPHGAGLTNLVFCGPDTTVCELHMNTYLNWCCRRLAAVRNAKYGCIVGETVSEHGAAEPWVHSQRWRLDVSKLHDVLANTSLGTEPVRSLPATSRHPGESSEIGAASGEQERASVRNNRFFETFFPNGYWQELAGNTYRTSDHSLCTDGPVFSYLIERTRPQTIIEVGSWHGHSANAMADACRVLGLTTRILCIDTFLGSVEHWVDPSYRAALHREGGRPTIYERFIGNTIGRGNRNIVFPLPIDSVNAALLLANFRFDADLIYLDASHDYDSVTSDITRFSALLSPNGLIFGDDYQYVPVAKAVHAFAEARGLSVFVSSLKWILAGPTVTATLLASPGYEQRISRDGWVHPDERRDCCVV
jgi:capsular polysaccharide biosynthesis protein